MHNEAHDHEHCNPADHPHGQGHEPGGRLTVELVEHLPFSVSATAIGLTLAGMICLLAPTWDMEAPGGRQDSHSHADSAGMLEDDHEHDHDHDHGLENHDSVAEGDALGAHDHDHDTPYLARGLFHLFHPMHMFFSAAATTAMFWRYERRWLKAIAVGLAGAIVVCGISDILLPYASQFILIGLGSLEAQSPLHLHVCVIEHPMLVLPFAVIGVIVGLSAAMAVERSTFFSHSLHVFSSTLASIFYLIGPFGRSQWIEHALGMMFLLVVLAVMVPCCLSDIVFPFAMARTARQKYQQEGHHH